MSTTSRGFFERMYRADRDPWSFASNDYERKRYSTILEFVPVGRFRMTFEPGCSIGELTSRLAERCGFVIAIDIAETAVELARRRCQNFANVDVHEGSLPEDIPDGPFDLIIFSEIGYYFTGPRLIALASELASHIEPGGQLLAVHWIGESADHLLTGQVVHDLLREHLPMDHVHHRTHRSRDRDGFVLDVWQEAATLGRVVQ
jgi:SAM-dependent methyltransferase